MLGGLYFRDTGWRVLNPLGGQTSWACHNGGFYSVTHTSSGCSTRQAPGTLLWLQSWPPPLPCNRWVCPPTSSKNTRKLCVLKSAFQIAPRVPRMGACISGTINLWGAAPVRGDVCRPWLAHEHTHFLLQGCNTSKGTTSQHGHSGDQPRVALGKGTRWPGRKQGWRDVNPVYSSSHRVLGTHQL